MNVPLVAGVLGGLALGAALAYTPVMYLLHRSVARRGQLLAHSLVQHLRRPAALAVVLSALVVASVVLPMPALLGAVVVHVVGAGLVAGICWFLVELTYVLSDVVLARHPLDAADNLRARQIQTEFELLRRVVIVAVCIVGLAVVLLSFPSVRAIGAGLLASAGLVGLLAGVAVQPLASNLVAGMQVALAQPIRADDVVLVNGHWGKVEEIHLTYVVVRDWDLHRLVLPISYFTTQPFENWTRSSADVLGWAYIEVDYSAPVEAIRARFHEIVKESPDWDGNVAVLQVTNLGLTMQLRAVMSSSDSSRSWDLQCEVREKLIAFLQEHYPGALPRLRTELHPADAASDGRAPRKAAGAAPA